MRKYKIRTRKKCEIIKVMKEIQKIWEGRKLPPILTLILLPQFLVCCSSFFCAGPALISKSVCKNLGIEQN